MELKDCVIKSVLPEQSGVSGRTGNDWFKSGFVVEWMDNGYAKSLCLEVMGRDRWDGMKGCCVVGNRVDVRFDVSSREWQGRWFTSAVCWGLSLSGGNNGHGQQQVTQQTQRQNDVPDDVPLANGGAPNVGSSAAAASDLPF